VLGLETTSAHLLGGGVCAMVEVLDAEASPATRNSLQLVFAPRVI
jgi:hypothetical protein